MRIVPAVQPPFALRRDTRQSRLQSRGYIFKRSALTVSRKSRSIRQKGGIAAGGLIKQQRPAGQHGASPAQEGEGKLAAACAVGNVAVQLGKSLRGNGRYAGHARRQRAGRRVKIAEEQQVHHKLAQYGKEGIHRATGILFPEGCAKIGVQKGQGIHAIPL